MMSRQRTLRCDRFAITLMEVLISIILVSTIMLVTLQASSTVLRMREDQQVAVAASQLVRIYADEISSLEFRDLVAPDFGIEVDENASSRNTLDDVDDFSGHTDSPPKHRDGEDVVGFSGWSVSVTVTPADLDGNPLGIADADTAPLRIVAINCTAPNGISQSGTFFVSHVPHGIDSDQSYQRMRLLSLYYSEDRRITLETPMRNRPPLYP